MWSQLKVWWWKRALNSKKLPDVERAVRSLVATRHPAVPEILRSLLGRSQPGGVHRVAVQGLVATGDPAVPDMLRPFLAPPNTSETAKGLLDFGWQPPTEQERVWLLIYARQYDRAVADFGERSVDALVRTFETEPPQRKKIVEALAQLGEGALAKLRRHILSLPFLSGIWGSVALTRPGEKDLQELLVATASLSESIVVDAATGENAHGERAKQNAIVKWLTPMQDQAVPAIVPLLRSPCDEIRRLAAHVLKAYGWKPADDRQRLALDFAAPAHLRGNLSGSDAEVVQFLVESFAVDGHNLRFRLDEIDRDWRRSPAAQAAVPFLAAAVRGADVGAALGAIGGLAEIRGEPELALIREALRASDRRVRAQAATTAGELRDRSSVEPLLRLLDDEDEVVRERAACSLGRIGDQLAIDGLVRYVEAAGNVLEAVVGALGQFSDPRAAQALVRVLGHCSHESQEVCVLEALWRIRTGSERVARQIGEEGVARYAERRLSQLNKALEDPVLRGSLGERERTMSEWDMERVRVAKVIAGIGKPAAGAAQFLLRLIQPDQYSAGQMRWELNLAAARALARIGEGERVLPVVTAWVHKNAGCSSFTSAVEILGEIGPPAADVLRSFLTHESSAVCEAARVQLDRISRPEATERVQQ